MNPKRLLLIILLLAPTTPTFSCDVCGSGAGNYYMGMLPEFPQKIIGLRYRSNVLNSHLSPTGEATYLSTKERFQTMEIWGGWTIKQKFRIIAQVPLVYNKRKSMETDQTKAGIGDLSIGGYYQVFHHQSVLGARSRSLLLEQYLWLGGGFKFPTGRYEPADKNPAASGLNLFQTGSGSWDLILNGMYETRISNAGLNLTASYKINTANQYGYRYGNRLSGIAQLYYIFQLPNGNVLTPHTGVQYEQSHKDLENGYNVHASGGQVIYGSFGLEWTRRSFAAGLNWQPVFNQDLGAGTVRAANRAMLHVALLF